MIEPLARPLFRGLRQEEVDAGNILIPRSADTFVAPPRLPLTGPFDLAESPANAVRDHQWEGRYPTRGVSTSFSFEIARGYASAHVVVRVDTVVLESLGIRQYEVGACLPLHQILKPKDQEVILVSDVDGPFPPACIAEVIMV
jgi:hypothetical protein